MRSTRPLFASGLALAAFALVVPGTGSAQNFDIELVGVVGEPSDPDPSCSVSALSFLLDQTANTVYTPATTGPDGGRVDILALADENGIQQQFRAGLGAGVECTVAWRASISSDGDGMINRTTFSDYVDYTAQVGFGGNTNSFSTTGGTAEGARVAAVNFNDDENFVEVIIANLPDLPDAPLAAGTYVDTIFLEIEPQT